MSGACDDEGLRRAPEGRPAGEAWPPLISGQAIADEGKTDMRHDSKGDGSYTHGNSFANGPQDGTLRDWQMRLVREATESIWRFP